MQVRNSGTRPELTVRDALRERGVLFTTNDASLPGSPDVVIRGRRLAVFINGCFWHAHGPSCLDRKSGERSGGLPRRRRGYWAAKFKRNNRRDRGAVASLEAAGWRVLTVWECQTKRPRYLAVVLDRWL